MKDCYFLKMVTSVSASTQEIEQRQKAKASWDRLGFIHRVSNLFQFAQDFPSFNKKSPIRGRNKMLPAISVNEGCCSHQPSHYSRPNGEPWRNSGWKQRMPAALQSSDCSHPRQYSLRNLRMRKHRVLSTLNSQPSYRMDKKQSPTVQHRDLYSISWDKA